MKSIFQLSPVLLGSLSFGTLTSFAGIALQSYEIEYPEIADEKNQNLISWFSDGPRLSGALGPFILNFFIDKLGRRMSLSIVSFCCAICWFLLLFMSGGNLKFGVIIRTIQGLFWGIIACLNPVYVSELAPYHLQGLFGSLHQLFIILGICLNNILGVSLKWRELIYFGGIINLLLSGVVFMAPESPATIRMKKEVYAMNESLLEKKYVLVTISSAVMLFFQQFSGINAILGNLSDMMSSSGMNLHPNIQSALSTLAQFIACGVACFLMDDLGPRALWNFSSFLCLVCLLCYAIARVIESSAHWIPVLCIFIYCLAFGIGQGPCPWVIFPNSYPDKIRYIGCCWMMFSHWICSFIVTYCHPIILASVGEFYAFIIYSICCFGSLIYGVIFLPKKDNHDRDQDALF